MSSHPFVSSVLELVLERRKKESKQKKDKESKDQSRKSWIKQLQQEYLQVISCIYVFLVGFDMHGMCMLVFGSFVVVGMDFVGFGQWILAFP